jgi:hypothetical protein
LSRSSDTTADIARETSTQKSHSQMIGAVVLSTLCFLCAGFSCAAPFFLDITWISAATTSTYHGSFLLLDRGDTAYVLMYGWCTAASTTCDDYILTLEVLFGFYALAAIFAFVCIILTAKHSVGAFVLLPLSLAFQGVANFGYFYRALPLLEQLLYEQSAATSITWTWNYATYSAGAGIVFTFVTILFYTLRFKTAVREDRAKLAGVDAVDAAEIPVEGANEPIEGANEPIEGANEPVVQ